MVARNGERSSTSLDFFGIAAVALLAYVVMAGDYLLRDSIPIAVVFDAAVGMGTVLLYISRARGRSDRLDILMVVAVVLFAVSAVFSAFPRQSFDSVLAALLFVAALFVARDVLSRASARGIFIVALTALSLTLTATAAVSWLGLYLRWWSLTDWSVVPPLGMNLPSSPWGHRHDLAILLAMLYPAWWVGRIRLLRAAAAVAIGLVDLALIVIGGSRMVWIAVVVATALLALPWFLRLAKRNRRRLVFLGAVGVAVAGGVVVAGAMGPLAERLLGSASLAERTAMWGPLVQDWTQKPLVGFGPGSFPWILQQTAYFDTHSFAPRHPDSAIVQLLAEGGIVGLTAMGVVVYAVMRASMASGNRAATWAVVAFGIAAIGGNPTDFHFMVAVALAWVAYALPHTPIGPTTRERSQSSTIGIALAVGLVIVGLAFGATTVARVAYANARAKVTLGQFEQAGASLEMAMDFDPGMALYPRQLGESLLASGSAAGSVYYLRRAVQINPNDDLAWRSLALAYRSVGDDDLAKDAIGRAIGLQRSDSANLMLQALLARDANDEEAAQEDLAEIVQAWPEVVAAPNWKEFAGAGVMTTSVLQAAGRRWSDGKPSPEPLDIQAVLIHAVLTGSGDPSGVASGVPASVAREYGSVMACEPDATSLLAAADDADRRQATYWAAVARAAHIAAKDDDAAALIYKMMTGDDLLTGGWDETLNPLNENSTRAASGDRWGYRRQPIQWPEAEIELPLPRSGLKRLLLDPAGAAKAAGLQTRLGACS